MSHGAKITLYIALGAVIIFALLLVSGIFQTSSQRALAGKIVVWDIPRTNTGIQSFFQRYRSPGVSIDYQIKNPSTYDQDLLNALAAGDGPDIFLLKNSDLSRYTNKITPLLATNQDGSEFRGKAADAVLQEVTDSKGNIYGIPWSVDTLALYYNKDDLNAANIVSPPKTWQEFQDDSKKLTRLASTGAIDHSGASMGLAVNVQYAPDIFFSLLFQEGNPIYTTLSNPPFHLTDTGVSGDTPSSALAFYTNFANPNSPNYTWNSTKPEALEAFAAGESSFYIGYARDLPLVLQKNPHLNFSVAPLPQLDPSRKISYTSYEMFSVVRTSTHAELAWHVLSALFSAAAQKSVIDAMGLPPSHRDLVPSKPPNPILQPWYDQVLSARSWFIPGVKALAIFRTMIDSVVLGAASSQDALFRGEAQLKLLLPQ